MKFIRPLLIIIAFVTVANVRSAGAGAYEDGYAAFGIGRLSLCGRGLFTVDEQRKSSRHRTLNAGTIAFGQAGGIDCVVCNISAQHPALQGDRIAP